jgi:hypothetical protein
MNGCAERNFAYYLNDTWAYRKADIGHCPLRVEMDFPSFRGHVNLALIGALGVCDGHEIQYRSNTASL